MNSYFNAGRIKELEDRYHIKREDWLGLEDRVERLEDLAEGIVNAGGAGEQADKAIEFSAGRRLLQLLESPVSGSYATSIGRWSSSPEAPALSETAQATFQAALDECDEHKRSAKTYARDVERVKRERDDYENRLVEATEERDRAVTELGERVLERNSSNKRLIELMKERDQLQTKTDNFDKQSGKWQRITIAKALAVEKERDRALTELSKVTLERDTAQKDNERLMQENRELAGRLVRKS